ncbi:transporter substrate-binding domain-containing protein [Chitinimonas viridis]|uniref:Transporter substrate-binding domain-containing protein n=1 Tax=Chitinimonas viridis TaxID=664880 RepID=A0ABT8B9T0_9NEIS|nr:transporter substrate-binding domain-containing protein [Chitinimonas viridis]MDN3578249.1 transporter substrate-binding domain-containing protein [Chitinimonas viridis]
MVRCGLLKQGFATRLCVGVLAWVLAVPAWAESLTICAEDDWYPYSALRDGTSVGMSVELARAAFAHKGVTALFESGSYQRCIRLTQQGRYVLTLNMAKTADREPTYLWPRQPLLEVRGVLWGRPGLVSGSLDHADLRHRQFGVVKGYEYPAAIADDRDIIKVEADSDAVNLRNIALGRVDVTLMDEKIGRYLIGRHGLAGKVVPYGVFERFPVYAVFSKRHPKSAHYLKLFEQGMAVLLQNGEYQRIAEAWPPKAAGD